MKIGICAASFLKNKELLEYAQKKLTGHQLFCYAAGDGLTEFYQDKQIILLGKQSFGVDQLRVAKDLRFVAKYGVGLDNINIELLTAKGIPVLLARGVNAPYVAEHTLGVILSLMRKISENSLKLHQSIWHKNGGTSLFQKKVFLIGFGSVAQALVPLLRPFNVEIAATDVVDKSREMDRLGVSVKGFEEGLEWCDLVSVHASLNSTSANLINSKLEERLRGKILINTSRGKIVDEPWLAKMVAESKLSVGLDVFCEEPLPEKSILCSSDGAVLTPHTAANSLESQWEMGSSAIDLICKAIEDTEGR